MESCSPEWLLSVANSAARAVSASKLLKEWRGVLGCWGHIFSPESWMDLMSVTMKPGKEVSFEGMSQRC